MKLTCDICSGNLMMLSGGKGAVCTNCGVTYDIERLREKLGVVPNNHEAASINNIQHVPADVAMPDETIFEADYCVFDDSENETKNLIIKRKRDLHLCKVAVIIDNNEPVILNGGGKETVISVSKGIHKLIVRFASAAGIIELDEQTFEVGEHDLIGEAGLYRGAFKAAYGFKIWEAI